MSTRNLLRWTSCLAVVALPACNVLVGADFDVTLRPEDGGGAIDGGRDASADWIDGADDGATFDGSSIDAPDASVDAPRDTVDADVGPDLGSPDAREFDVGSPDASDASDGDAGTDADGGFRPTILNGGFVYLGAPNPQPSPIELRGQIISNTIVRGTTADGITIQGRFQ